MKNFFQPQSVAVIGASKNKEKLGHQLLKNLIDSGYEGRIYPINLDDKEILGLKTYSSILDIHSSIDLAVIIIPREVVPMVTEQCVHKDVPHVLIISAGFAEKDSAGKKLQKKLFEITAGTKTRIIGPNCLGIIDTAIKLNLTFAATNVAAGGIGLILQSGAIGAAILDWAKEKELGISKFVSLGNKMQVSEIDALKIMGEDSQTKIIGLYLEEISDPIAFLRVCREISAQKPIIILKGGSTELGAKAASSHTAALTTSAKLDRALFAQANLIVAEEYLELLHFLELLSCKKFDAGRSLAIVTNAGGPGILAADAASKAGFDLPKLSGQDLTNFEEKIINYASLTNPFDLGGDALASGYQKVIELIEKSKNYSAILAIVTPQAVTEIEKTAEVIAKYRKSPKPVVAAFLGGTKIKPANKILLKASIPHFEDPALAIELLGKIHCYFQKKSTPKNYVGLNETESYRCVDDQDLIKRYKIDFVETAYIGSDSDAMAFVEQNDFPVAFKTNKPIKHKGRAGKVGLNIGDNASLIRAAKTIGYPAMIQKMVDSPYEVLIGARRDPLFGLTVVFGQGGIFAEENADVALRMMPLTGADIDEMIEETSVWKMIKRYKVKDQIKQVIMAVAKILVENADLESVEFNPFKVLNGKIIAVDIHTERKNG